MQNTLLAVAFSLFAFTSVQAQSNLQYEAEAEASAIIAYEMVTSGLLAVDLHSVEKEKTPDVKPKPEPITYKDAYALYKSERKPMVVMVSASWCGPCNEQKPKVKQMHADGKFGDVSLVILDWDDDRAECRQIVRRGDKFPLYVVYYYHDGEPDDDRSNSYGDINEFLKKSNRNEPPKTTPIPMESVSVQPAKQASYCRTCRG